MMLLVVYKKARKKLFSDGLTYTILKKVEQGEMQPHNHVVPSLRYQVVSCYLGNVRDMVLPVSVPILNSHTASHTNVDKDHAVARQGSNQIHHTILPMY